MSQTAGAPAEPSVRHQTAHSVRETRRPDAAPTRRCCTPRHLSPRTCTGTCHKQLALRLNEVCDTKLRTLNEKRDALTQLAAVTDHCVQFVQAALDGGSDTALLYSKTPVTAHLHRYMSQTAGAPAERGVRHQTAHSVRETRRPDAAPTRRCCTPRHLSPRTCTGTCHKQLALRLSEVCDTKLRTLLEKRDALTQLRHGAAVLQDTCHRAPAQVHVTNSWCSG
ncbi:hypothetical protein O0L34_g10360 [Tuta absoluta]|nr:hypothetical protein O0L34_g10360 [Tuta absoluta]